MTCGHTCQCQGCAPEMLPVPWDSPRQDAGHFAVRFEDDGYQPLLNHEPIDHAFEFMAGPDGWVARYVAASIGEGHAKPPTAIIARHVCLQCLDAGREAWPCAEVLYGVVDFRYPAVGVRA